MLRSLTPEAAANTNDENVKASVAMGLIPEPTQDGSQAPPPPQARPPLATEATGKADSVPAAEPLPQSPNQAASRSSQPSPGPRRPPPAQRPSSAGGTAPGTPNAPSRRTDVSPTQEISFDPQGMITMHANELDVRRLLELLSRQSGLNILVSPKVSGNITANFEKIPSDELLKSVLKLANLVEKVDGNVHYIYTREEVKDEAETKMKEKIVTKVYRLNYIRADEMMVMITPFLSPDVGRKRFATSANYLFGVSEASTLSAGGLGTTGGGWPAAAWPAAAAWPEAPPRVGPERSSAVLSRQPVDRRSRDRTCWSSRTTNPT